MSACAGAGEFGVREPNRRNARRGPRLKNGWAAAMKLYQRKARGHERLDTGTRAMLSVVDDFTHRASRSRPPARSPVALRRMRPLRHHQGQPVQSLDGRGHRLSFLRDRTLGAAQHCQGHSNRMARRVPWASLRLQRIGPRRELQRGAAADHCPAERDGPRAHESRPVISTARISDRASGA
jgi:hypothetical protein